MSEPTDLGYGRVGQAIFLVVPAVTGAALGWGLVALLNWLLGLPWIPRVPLSLLDSIPDAVALPVLIGLGVVAGGLFGLDALHDELFLTVGDDEVRLERGDADRRLPRTAVHAVFRSGGSGALLSMRAWAPTDGKAADARDLRAGLINLGVVVRVEGGKQYGRRADRSVES
jgi:hypothetical protein